MTHDAHHEHLIKELEEQFEPLFSKSPQGIYLYLDDIHKICNKKFADMLGYSSPQEWIKNEYPVEDIAEADREKGIQAYIDASENLKASTLPATWIKKDGKKLQTEVTLVPITYKNEIFALHFIKEIKK